MKKKIIILSGDPNSINSELIFKCWKKLSSKVKKKTYLISNSKLLRKQFEKLKYKLKITEVNDINHNENTNNLKVLNFDLRFKNPFKVDSHTSSKFVQKSLNVAHKLALKNNVKGIINCAINKNLLGNNKGGVTEFLAKKCKAKKNSEVMLIKNERLAVAPITTHIKVNEISKKINKKIIKNKVMMIDKWFKKNFKKKPKLAILGLNPHNYELNKNSEEKKIIIPAIIELKKSGVNLQGPFVADTIFINDYKKFDVIIGMYHDQVLAPFKSIFKFNAINVTLGLKYLRLSPDHGTAVNLIGKNKADTTSLMKCVNFVEKF